MEHSRDNRSLDAPLLKELLSRSIAALPPLAADPSAAAQTGVADFYSGWPSLSLWFKSEAMVDRYLPILNAFALALQSDCVADRSVAENYLRLLINACRLL